MANSYVPRPISIRVIATGTHHLNLRAKQQAYSGDRTNVQVHQYRISREVQGKSMQYALDFPLWRGSVIRFCHVDFRIVSVYNSGEQ
jgi:hypothetical protein